jgi:hypothetical protein
MSKRSDAIEVALYRGDVLRQRFVRHHLTRSCEIVARHVARLNRWRILQCNGIERWDSKARGMFAGWTDEDQARMEREVEKSRGAIEDQLRPFLTPGCVWKFYTDPRAGVLLRISTRDNRRDCFF